MTTMFDRHNPQAGSYTLYDPEAPMIQPKRPPRDTTKIVLTPEQEDWLREHYATTYNKDCAAHLGISESSLHRHARRLGLKKDPKWFYQVELLHCQMMADANRGSGNHGTKNLLIYGQPHRFRKGQTNRERYGEENERRRIQRAAATRRETIRKERMRVRWGLPQETKLRVISNPQARYARYALKSRGYIIPGRGSMEAYWDENTTRSTVVENNATKVGIKVKPVEVLQGSALLKQPQ